MDSVPYEANLVSVEDQPGTYILLLEADPLPAEMSLLVGEFLYQLRATLDHLVYTTAELDSNQSPPPKPNQLEFPICETKSTWNGQARRIEPLSDDHRSWIEQAQPCSFAKPKDNALFWLNELARIDRHRLPHVAAIYPVVAVPEVRLGRKDAVVEWLEVDDELRAAMESDVVVAYFRVQPFDRGDSVEANPNAELLPEIDELLGRRDESSFIRHAELGKRLLVMEESVAHLVARFEFDHAGATVTPFHEFFSRPVEPTS